MNKAPMWQDPNESSMVRELLQAGRSVSAHDYDVEAGLAQHMSLIDAGAPLPDWAENLGASGTPARGPSGLLGGSGISGLMLTSMAVGVIGAAAGAYMAFTAKPERAPSPAQQPPVAEIVLPVSDAAARLSGTPAGQDVEVAVGAQWQPVRRHDGEVAAGRGARAGSQVHRHSEKGRGQALDRPLGRGADSHARQPYDVRSGQTAQRGLARHSDGVVAMGHGPARDGQNRGQTGGQSARHSDTDRDVERAVGSTEMETTAKRASTSTDGQRAQKQVPAVSTGNGNSQPPGSTVSVGAESTAPGVVPEPVQEQPVDDMRLEREMRMLKVAQEILDKDPARALRLAEAGEKEFPGSLFTQERQYLLIAALAKVGRVEAARKRATVYLKTYPQGPFSDRVRQALGVE